jgi:hypothetical protein
MCMIIDKWLIYVTTCTVNICAFPCRGGNLSSNVTLHRNTSKFPWSKLAQIKKINLIRPGQIATEHAVFPAFLARPTAGGVKRGYLRGVRCTTVQCTVFRIRDILVHIQIQILGSVSLTNGSVSLTNGSGSIALFVSNLQDANKK